MSLTVFFLFQKNMAQYLKVRIEAVLMPSKIAKRSTKSSTKDFIRFLHKTPGSLTEVKTKIEIAFR